MNKSFLLFLTFLFVTGTLHARDFQALSSDGQTLNFTVLDEEARTVETKQGENYNSGNCAIGCLTIPNTVRNNGKDYTVVAIGCMSFLTNYGLTEVVLPETVNCINEQAFEGCRELKNIKLGDSLVSIGNNAFCDCWKLSSIEIPNSVTTIEDGAFKGCSELRDVIIGNSMTTIGDGMFHGCRKLIGIKLGNSIVSIGNNAFSECDELKSIEIPNSVTTIGDGAFSNCGELKNVKLGNSVVSIGNNAFYNCCKLSSIEIPNSVTTIGDGAFLICAQLSSITLPKSITSIGSDAFSGCNNLKKINLESPNAWSTVKFGNRSSNPIPYIGHTFYVNDWEVEHLDLKLDEKSISEFSFDAAWNLYTIKIQCEKVGANAFSNNNHLEAICLDVKMLNSKCFENCYYIKSVYSLTSEPPLATSNTFPNYNATLYVPIGARENYVNTNSCWFRFAKIVESDFSNIDRIFKADYSEAEAGINDVIIDGNPSREIDYNAPYQVYNLNGVYISNSVNNLTSGIYIIRQGNLTKKVLVSPNGK